MKKGAGQEKQWRGKKENRNGKRVRIAPQKRYPAQVLSGQDKKLFIGTQQLIGRQVARSFPPKLLGTHQFDDIEGCPRHIVPQHVQL